MLSLALVGIMDSEPPVWALWLMTGTIGGLGFWSARKWIIPGFVVLAWQAVMTLGTHRHLTDPYFGPMILREGGHDYVVHTYLSTALSMAATVVGIGLGVAEWRQRRREKRKKSAAPDRVPVH